MSCSERFIRNILEMAHFSAKNQLSIGVVRLCEILHAMALLSRTRAHFFEEKIFFSGRNRLLSGIHLCMYCMFEHPPVANRPTTPLYSCLFFMTNQPQYTQYMRRALMSLCLYRRWLPPLHGGGKEGNGDDRGASATVVMRRVSPLSILLLLLLPWRSPSSFSSVYLCSIFEHLSYLLKNKTYTYQYSRTSYNIYIY